MKCPYARDFENGERAKCSLKGTPYSSCDHTWDGENNCSRHLQRHYEEMGWYQTTVPMELVIQAMDERIKRMCGVKV